MRREINFSLPTVHEKISISPFNQLQHRLTLPVRLKHTKKKIIFSSAKIQCSYIYTKYHSL